MLFVRIYSCLKLLFFTKGFSMSSNGTLTVKVTSRTQEGSQAWEGTVTLAGVRPSKLTRKSDGSTHFSTRAAVVQAANNFANSHNYSSADCGEVASATAKAAKRKTSSRTNSSPSSRSDASRQSSNANRQNYTQSR